jgi:Flp pilus assembly protein TadG
MSASNRVRRNRQSGSIVIKNAAERGFVLIFMALSVFALFGALGLAIDIGRLYISKNETQSFCDTAALSAALKLNGTSNGITNARNAVANSTNTWNMNTQTITNYQTDFATSSAGPWDTNPASPAGYTYVRVQTTVPVTLYFLPVIVSQFTQNVSSLGMAAQIPQTSFKRGLGPYTAVSTDTVSANFGLVVGNQYDIQWPNFNSTRSGCSSATPDACFGSSPPCTGDSAASKSAVTQNWGASTNGFWGSTNSSQITQEVMDVLQLQPVALQQNIAPALTAGNKHTEGSILDDRANQDGDTNNNNVTAYLNNPSHNGRRLLAIPIVDPVSTTVTNVIGYGAFLLMVSNGGGASNFYGSGSGNDPYCAVYAGPYTLGGTDTGASSSSGAFKVMLVQ